MATEREICDYGLTTIGEPPLDETEDDTADFTGTDVAPVTCKAIYAMTRNALLEMFNWRFAARMIYLDYEDQIYTIADVSQADPVVVTISETLRFTDYKHVLIDDVAGPDDLNGNNYRIANVDTTAKTFELEDVDGSGYDAYVSGGTVRLEPPFKYTYEILLPGDFLTDIGLYLDSSQKNPIHEFEIKEGNLLTDNPEIYLNYTALFTDTTKFSPLFAKALSHYLAIYFARRVSNDLEKAVQAAKDYRKAIDEAIERNVIKGYPSYEQPQDDWVTAGR